MSYTYNDGGRLVDCLYPIFDGVVQSFACDNYEDVEEFKL